MTRELIDATCAVVAIVVMLGFLWSITAGPMLANYADCGTIFLCENQIVTETNHED